jgi:hypothetical protein
VTVGAGAVVMLTIACSGCAWRSLISALPMSLTFAVLWIPLVSRLAFSCRVAKRVTPWYVTFHAFLLVLRQLFAVTWWFSFLAVLRIFAISLRHSC